MSRSNPTLINPAQYYFQWSGSKGLVEYWDKEAEERKPIGLPFTFMVLDELSTIAGYNKQEKSGYRANEVRNITTDELTVRTKHGIKQTGLYANLTDPRAKGAKYAKAVYITHKDLQGEYVISKFTMVGSALSEWINLSQEQVVGNGTIEVTKGDLDQTGPAAFYRPIFTYRSSTEDEDKAAWALDRELQKYLTQYLAAAQFDRISQVDVAPVDSALGAATPDQVADYNKRRAEAEGAKPRSRPMKEDVVIEDIGDEPINLDDIPF